MIASGRNYAIGIILPADDAESAAAAMRRAGERLHHRVTVTSDPAELDGATLDFALADVAVQPFALDGVPVFGLVSEAQAGWWTDEQWNDDDGLQGLSRYDGLFASSERVQLWLRGLCLGGAREQPVGFFAVMPERQFLACQIEKVIGSGAFRVCYVGDAARHGGVVAELSQRPYLRPYSLDKLKQGSLAAGAAAFGQWVPADGSSTQRLYAGFGAGLVVAGSAALRTLGEIVSVGAVAICPDLPWIRRHFDDSVWYYPQAQPAAVAQAVDGAVEEIESDARRAAERGRAARAVFEERFSAETMLAGAVAFYKAWRARPPAVQSRDAATVNTMDSSARSVFARLADKALINVAQSTTALGPLQPVPNWRFSAFTKSRDLAVHVRHSLWMAAQARGGKLPVIIPWHGGTRLRLFLDNDLSRTLFSGGCFEPNEFALLDRILQPGMVFVDGGANEGTYTIFAAARVESAGRVIALEPSRREVERLRGNIALNRMRNVEVVEAALVEASGSVDLLVAEPEHAGQNTLGAFAYEGIRSVGTEQVAAITVDELVEQHKLARVDVLKLDLEGAELRALRGARRTLAGYRPLILTEVLEPALVNQGGSAAALFEAIEDAGYVLLTMDDATGEPVPLRPSNLAPSGNIVAVHIDRDWGLLAGLIP